MLILEFVVGFVFVLVVFVFWRVALILGAVALGAAVLLALTLFASTMSWADILSGVAIGSVFVGLIVLLATNEEIKVKRAWEAHCAQIIAPAAAAVAEEPPPAAPIPPASGGLRG